MFRFIYNNCIPTTGTTHRQPQAEYEDLAIQLFSSSINATKQLIEEVFAPILPHALRTEQYQMGENTPFRDGPHVTLLYVKRVPKLFSHILISEINNAVKNDVSEFRFVIGGVKWLQGDYCDLSRDGRFHDNKHLVVIPDPTTFITLNILQHKCLAVVNLFCNDSKHNPFSGTTVDLSIYGSKYRPHISVFSVTNRAKSNALRAAFAANAWKFDDQGFHELNGKSFLLNSIVVE